MGSAHGHGLWVVHSPNFTVASCSVGYEGHNFLYPCPSCIALRWSPLFVQPLNTLHTHLIIILYTITRLRTRTFLGLSGAGEHGVSFCVFLLFFLLFCCFFVLRSVLSGSPRHPCKLADLVARALAKRVGARVRVWGKEFTRVNMLKFLPLRNTRWRSMRRRGRLQRMPGWGIS